MYSSAANESTGTLVGVFSGADTTDVDYARSLDAMNRVDSAAAAASLPFTYIVVVDNDVPRPPPVWRKRFSDATCIVKAERFYFAMVTNSMLMRGVYTAIHWITAKREHHFYNVVANVDDARAWLQAQPGVSCPDLTLMERRARGSLRNFPRVEAR